MSPSSARRGKLLVISGPAGVGKTTVCERLAGRPGFARSISATTRPPRKGETDGVDYHFMSPDRFREGVEAGEFLEWAEVHGHMYGTPRAHLRQVQDRGLHAILNIDVQGAIQLRKQGEEGLYIFLLPPDHEALRERLFKRRTDRPEEVERRLAQAEWEIAQSDAYDHRVVNDDLDRAVTEIEATIVGSLD